MASKPKSPQRQSPRRGTATTGQNTPEAPAATVPEKATPNPVRRRTTKPAVAATKVADKPVTAKKPAAKPRKTVAEAASTRASDVAPDPVAPKAAAAAQSADVAANLMENLERIEALSQRLMTALSSKAPSNPGVESPGPDLYMNTASAWMKMLTEQPSKVIEQQVSFWGETLKHYAKAQTALSKGKLAAPEDDGPKDRRFANPLWQTHPFFNFVKKQYQINVGALRAAAADLEMPDTVARRRLDWLTAQIVDMLAPTNFLATNPDALEKAVATEGASLVKGLENLVRDVEHNSGEMLVTLADRDAFTVGENIGTAEGTVVYRSPLFELIQYAPTTEQVHRTPIVLFPPWINKFYILDLKPENSLIRWLVGQGHTLFVVSWKNPDPSFAQTGMADYVAAYLDATDQVQALTGEKKLNLVGYCIGGTTLAATLGVLKQRGDTRANSATFFTTLTDFSELGEFVTFLQPDFVEGIREETSRHGVFPAHLMSRTMSFLRANDLVWGPAIRSYMLGDPPPAFDLLYWNGDSTNLPGKMTMDYLDGLCVANQLAGAGFDVLGHKVTLTDVTVPLCSIACESDHIAPWRDCWRGVAGMGSKDKRFILSESGHIAGIVNPPSKKKYGHYTGSADFSGDQDAWKDASPFQEGSWWPNWGEWLNDRAGAMIPARDPGAGLGAAPGTYVHERAAWA